MDESRFRALMHVAIGDDPMQPWLATAVRSRLAEPPRGQIARPMAAVAVILVAAVVVAGLVLPQVLANRHVPNTGPRVLPAATPSATPAAALIDPTNCRLPVTVERGAGPPSQVATQVGFVNTRTGSYTRDANPSVVRLPGGGMQGTMFYSSAVQRWLPTNPTQVAPDGRSYAWIQSLPIGAVYSRYKASKLHIYDLVSSVDQAIFTYRGAMSIWRWDAAGIHAIVGQVNADAPPQTWRLVDPATGALTRDTISPVMSFPPFKPLPGDRHDSSFTSPGMTADGHTIWWTDNLDNPGASDWVFYETTPGHRVYLYRGVEGAATSFDPELALVDSTGIWFSDADYVLNLKPALWHWQVGGGLRKYRLSGLPSLFSGSNAYILVRPAGPCF
ncbi:MAG TPA: hypothetical protein VIP57_10555 [Candidatus Dormibacteraeota bacterium]|jgi:hypothetical protein